MGVRAINFLGECYRGHDDDFFIASDAPIGDFWHRLKHFRRHFKKVRDIQTPAAEGSSESPSLMQ